ESDFHLFWNFAHCSTVSKSNGEFGDSSFGDTPVVEFNNVHLQLGSYITNLVGPAIEKVQQLTAPVKDFFEYLGKPIPGISDLAKLVGDNDGVSILDIAGIVGAKAGEPYSTYVTLGKATVEIVNALNQVKGDLSGNSDLSTSFIDLGNFVV